MVPSPLYTLGNAPTTSQNPKLATYMRFSQTLSPKTQDAQGIQGDQGTQQ
jgi:hypothetical protein